ncbi:PAAR domain-containing protein [Photobacterium nomapromontoriensis]|uniref:PAAR domain-containing protein n=1 Tax=Photobacterium nomapromontoriensis TaxID=2910237 RepID=UPI003D0DDF15
MGKPAARISDPHSCPKKTGKIPHVGGPIAAGSPNVFIGGLPAARVGDMMVCVGPPDSIAQGSASVFINGKPAARMGDSSSHGGVIIGGCGTVTIGDAGIVVPSAIASNSGQQFKQSQPSGQYKQSDDQASSEPAILATSSETVANQLQQIADRDMAAMEICQKRQDGSCSKPNCECM